MEAGVHALEHEYGLSKPGTPRRKKMLLLLTLLTTAIKAHTRHSCPV